MKKILTAALTAVLLVASLGAIVHAQNATPTTQQITLDGETISPAAFNIGGSNFFMLRDIAYLLNGTAAQFDVVWDGQLNAINILTGQAYNPVGGELTMSATEQVTASEASVSVYLNGYLVQNLTAFNIGGNNFFMLRDLADILLFGAAWDEDTRTVVLTTEPTPAQTLTEASFALSEFDVEHSYVSATYDDITIPTVASLVVTDFNIVESNDQLEYTEGFEWRIVRATAIFEDDNAWASGWRRRILIMNYYSIDMDWTSDRPTLRDEDGSTVWRFFLDGELAPLIFAVEDVQREWTETHFIVISDIAVRVPIGFDGIVISFANPANNPALHPDWVERPIRSGEAFDENSLFFRLR